MGNCMPREQIEYIEKIQKDCLESTNMSESEAYSFAFRCWQLDYVKSDVPQNWISVKDKMPGVDTDCCVTVRIKEVRFDYNTCKQIGAAIDDVHMTDAYYNENGEWEVELWHQEICMYYGGLGHGAWVDRDEVDNEKFKKGENKIIVDIPYKKKYIDRITVEVLAWFPLMYEPYKGE